MTARGWTEIPPSNMAMRSQQDRYVAQNCEPPDEEGKRVETGNTMVHTPMKMKGTGKAANNS